MDPMTLASLIQAVPAVAQGIVGVVQGIKGNKMGRDLKDPFYEPPQAATQALGNARNASYSRNMAGQGNLQNEIEQRNASSVSDVLAGATSGVDALAALTAINKNTLNSQNQLGFQSARDYEGRQRELRGQLNNYAGYQDKQFEINTMQPFLRDAAAASALKNAGLTNAYQGLKGAANAGSAIAISEGAKNGLGGGITPDQWNQPNGNPSLNNGFVPKIAGAAQPSATDFATIMQVLSGINGGSSLFTNPNTINKD